MVPLLAAITIFFFSCQRNEGVQTGGTAVSGGNAAAAAELTPVSAVQHGYILRVNASLMTIDNDTGSEEDRTRWVTSMSLGERVTILEERRATWEGRVFDFVKIRRDDGRGAEGFAFATQIAIGGKLGVVIDERTNIFGSPRPIDVTSTLLSHKTVVVWFPETERDGFVEIRAFDPVAQALRQNYIRTGSISIREADIQSSILMQTAQPLRTEGPEQIRREALLQAALLDYPDSVFNAEITALLNPNAAFVIETELAVHPFMIVTEDNVNIRDLPDVVAGRVISQLNSGDNVRVNQQTANDSTIGGQSARWYHITEPLVGWIFGAYLE